jgi:hypothetical protein
MDMPIPNTTDQAKIDAITSYNKPISCEYYTGRDVLSVLTADVPDEVCVAIAHFFQKILKHKIRPNSNVWIRSKVANSFIISTCRCRRDMYEFLVFPGITGSGSASDNA